LARDSSGYLYAVYNKYNAVSGYYNIMISRSTDTGETWTEDTLHADASNSAYTPKIAIDSSDNIFVVWEGKDPTNNPGKKNILLIKGTWGSWGAKEEITDSTLEQFVPGIAID